ncbi:MAG: glycosyltransferase family 2 protein [Labedaea sp.]
MPMSDTLVSIGLPVYNGAHRLEEVVWSVLGQDHDRIELVICDNASTDDTEAVCRELAAADSRVVYHRQPRNVGVLNNFVHAIRTARGKYFRWIGDDDWLAPDCVSRCLEAFAEDERRVLVTTQLAYTGPDGITRTDPSYDGGRLAAADPVTRFAEMLRLLNESPLLVDPLYGVMRRDLVVTIPRRNMLREDEVFATKLALAGPWGHVPEILAHRNTREIRITESASFLGVPSWQAHFANTLQCAEILRWLQEVDLTETQRKAARTALGKMFLGRQRNTAVRRSRKLVKLAAARLRPQARASSATG